MVEYNFFTQNTSGLQSINNNNLLKFNLGEHYGIFYDNENR